MQRLSILTDRLKAEGILESFLPGREDRFDRLVFDSREVGPNDCYVAIRGTEIDGHMFIDKAVNNGAIAIVCEVVPVDSRGGNTGTAIVHVKNSRKALTTGASLLSGDPGKALTMVGITGTNGKTTTASLIRQILEAEGIKTGFIGTTGYSDGEAETPATHTTPSPVKVYDLLARMQIAGCEACSMEISSHALDQHRVRIGDFEVGVFTNLTHDHLDYHGTEEAYVEAKKRLFTGLRADAVAVVNVDDPHSEKMVAGSTARVISYGCHRDADARIEILDDTISGLLLSIGGFTARFNLIGRFNAWNIAAAYAAGIGLGIPGNRILEALKRSAPVPGRFELLRGRAGKNVVVDYAHTPDALQNILTAAARIRPESARLWCVFGCGGDRDRSKRHEMGRIAEQLADRVIVTSDNPRTEDPERILDDIRHGMKFPDRAYWITDRREAIRFSSEESTAHDMVLIAGKGHETYQVIGTDRLPFDDREEARNAFGSDSESRHGHDPVHHLATLL